MIGDRTWCYFCQPFYNELSGSKAKINQKRIETEMPIAREVEKDRVIRCECGAEAHLEWRFRRKDGNSGPVFLGWNWFSPAQSRRVATMKLAGFSDEAASIAGAMEPRREPRESKELEITLAPMPHGFDPSKNGGDQTVVSVRE